MVLSKNMH